MTRFLFYNPELKSDAIKQAFLISLAFLCTGLMVRFYEYWQVTANYVLPGNAIALYADGILYDLLFLSLWAVFFSLTYLLLALWHKTASIRLVSVLIWGFLMIYVALIQYFAEVLTPLGRDFFAYNLTEVSDTLWTSTDITAGRVLPLILFPLLYSSLLYGFKKLHWNREMMAGGICSVLLFAGGYFFLYPSDSRFEREIDYALTVNKANVFSEAALSEFMVQPSDTGYAGADYPLLHRPEYEDVLGPFFETGERPPNLVFIIMESFGGTLMPPHDEFGGFTPFLDSLATQSLYWTHFLATSGRSFNAQPSIFGSLPYGGHGFMEMGYRAPEHHSLIRILNDNGYHTGYYCGYNSRFDKLDQFLELQEIDLLMDASRFTDEYRKMDEIEGGFTWGYSDKDTYRRAFDFINRFDHQSPRLDIFFTLNFHEPFIIPETERYRQLFTERLGELEMNERKKSEYEQYAEIFMALLYTDDAIRELINRYRQREDYEDTIFVITGDHRMIPVPHKNRIDRYYVPFMIYSPMLKEPVRFEGVSSHLDVAPSLTVFLEKNYSIEAPDPVHWLGQELNTSREFSANRNIPLMRTKNDLSDYLSDNLFLSGDQLFELKRGMELTPVNDSQSRQELTAKLEEFKRINRYVTAENRLVRSSEEDLAHRDAAAEEERFLLEHNLDQMNTEELFFRARELAFTHQYGDARLILRRVLRENPNFHDARLLLGRTFGWDGEYETAESHFDEVIRRNPDVLEAYEAKADLYYWRGDPQQTLEIAETGLERNSRHVPLLFRKARAYRQDGNNIEARRVLEEALEIAPENEDLQNLEIQL